MKNLFYFSMLMIFVNITITAQPGFEPDTIFVSPGWNLIGSKFSGAVSDMVTTEPPGILASPFYRYNVGGGYLAADTLEKSSGYWVKVSNQQNGPGLTFIMIYPPSTGWACGNPFYGRVWHGTTFHRTVQIGSQCWLKSNLNIGIMIDGSENQTNNGVIEKYCYGDDESNCAAYGGLYQWDEAMDYETGEGVRGICPQGWHIPNYVEFSILITEVGSNGNALKSVGQGSGSGAGTNTSSFSALLSGVRQIGSAFNGINSITRIWSATSSGSFSAYLLSLEGDSNLAWLADLDKDFGLSVRCIKD